MLEIDVLIPFRDDNPTRTFPLVVFALIATNVVVFLYQQTLSTGEGLLFLCRYGAIPAVLLGGASLDDAIYQMLAGAARFGQIPRGGAVGALSAAALQPIWLSLFTSMFLHGGLLHLGGNMLYLWIFGNNVEDTLGHFRFLLFYLLCGLFAAAAQMLLGLHSLVPMIGASGAIAGVLGAYYVKFPRARVDCLLFLAIFITVVALPAGLVLFLWFLLQVFEALGAAGAYAGQGGVAFFAHIGGFIAGWLLIRRFDRGRRRPVIYSRRSRR